jgi:hypothetical protein
MNIKKNVLKKDTGNPGPGLGQASKKTSIRD